MKKIADIVAYLTIFSALVFLIAYSYWNFYPFVAISFEKIDTNGYGYYDVITPVVKRGEIMQYHSEFTKLMDIKGTVSCYFEDGILFRLPEFKSDNPIGKNDTTRGIKIPETLPDGRYRYTCQIFYDLTMHRVLEYRFYTDYFEVID